MDADLVSDIVDLAGASANPVTALLAGIKMARVALPEVATIGGNVLRNLPDIERRFADLEAAMQKAHAAASALDVTSAAADLGNAWKSAMAIYDDVGLPHSLVQTVLAMAVKPPTGAQGLAADAVAALTKQLGRIG